MPDGRPELTRQFIERNLDTLTQYAYKTIRAGLNDAELARQAADDLRSVIYEHAEGSIARFSIWVARVPFADADEIRMRYLKTIAHRRAVDWLDAEYKRRKRFAEPDISADPERDLEEMMQVTMTVNRTEGSNPGAEEYSSSPEKIVLADAGSETLHEALNVLDDEQKRVIELAAEEENYALAAQRLQVSTGNFRIMLHRARQAVMTAKRALDDPDYARSLIDSLPPASRPVMRALLDCRFEPNCASSKLALDLPELRRLAGRAVTSLQRSFNNGMAGDGELLNA